MSEPVASAPVDVDLRASLPHDAPDQGPRPMCLPFAVTGAHNAQCLEGGETARAVEALWYHALNHGRAHATGTTLAAILDAAATAGQPAAEDWPFDPTLGVGTQDPPMSCGPPPWRAAPFREVPLAHDGREVDIEHELSEGRAVVLVLEIGDEFTFPDLEGFVAVPDLRAEMGDYHAVLAVGAVNTHLGRHLIVRNSWGTGWAVDGHCLLPLAYLEAFAVQAASLASGT